MNTDQQKQQVVYGNEYYPYGKPKKTPPPKFLLESQVEKKEVDTSDQDSDPSVFSMIPDLSFDQMKLFTQEVEKAFEPRVKHQELLDKIAEVIRSIDSTDEEKIDKITDLLL